MNQTLALLGMPGWAELMLLAAVGVLIFCKRLPEVGRSIGRSIVEFKKGVKGIEDDVDHASASKAQSTLPDESLARGDSASVEEAMGKVMPDADNDSCHQADECYIVPQLPGMSIQVHASICSPTANPGGSAQ